MNTIRLRVFASLFTLLLASAAALQGQTPQPAQATGVQWLPCASRNVPRSVHDYRFDYGDTSKGYLKRCFREKRCRIIIARAELDGKIADLITKEIEDAYQLIEPLGANQMPVNIYLVRKIQPRFAVLEKELSFSGLCFEQGSGLHIAIECQTEFFDVLAHELCHLRLSELELDYPWWLDEGVAECFESWDYLARDHLETLRGGRIASREELDNYKPLQGRESVVRATAWAMCYHLLIQKQCAFSSLEHEAGRTTTEAAVGSVLAAVQDK